MKNTKRSMIITTLLMVVVLVVAISTSTFAWYTSASSGTASQANLISAQSSSANIAVDWVTESEKILVEFDPANQEVSPAVPTAIPQIGTTRYDAFSVYTATISNEGKFNDAGATTATWNIKGTGSYTAQDYFYVINNNKNAGATITMTIKYTADVDDDPAIDGDQSITYSNNDKLVVAVFVDDVFQGIFTKVAGGYVYGTITQNGSSSELANSKDSTVVKDNIQFDLAASGAGTNYAKISVKAWLDGSKLTQDYANQLASFSFSFSGATIA